MGIRKLLLVAVAAMLIGAVGCTNPFDADEPLSQSLELAFQAPLLQRAEPQGAAGVGRYIVPAGALAEVQVTGIENNFRYSGRTSLSEVAGQLQGRVEVGKVPAGKEYTIEVTVYDGGEGDARQALHFGSTQVAVSSRQSTEARLYLLPHEDVIVSTIDMSGFNLKAPTVAIDHAQLRAWVVNLPGSGRYAISVTGSDLLYAVQNELGEVVATGDTSEWSYDGNDGETYYIGIFNDGDATDTTFHIDYEPYMLAPLPEITAENLPRFTNQIASDQNKAMLSALYGFMSIGSGVFTTLDERLSDLEDSMNPDGGGGSYNESIHEVIDEKDEHSRVYGLLSLDVSGSDNEQSFSITVDARLDGGVELLGDIKLFEEIDDEQYSDWDDEEYRNLQVRAGSRLDADIEVAFSMDWDEKTGVDFDLTAGGTVHMGITVDGVDGYAGKFILQFDYADELLDSFGADGEDPYSLFETYLEGVTAQLDVYNNDNRKTASYTINYDDVLAFLEEFIGPRINGAFTVDEAFIDNELTFLFPDDELTHADIDWDWVDIYPDWERREKIGDGRVYGDTWAGHITVPGTYQGFMVEMKGYIDWYGPVHFQRHYYDDGGYDFNSGPIKLDLHIDDTWYPAEDVYDDGVAVSGAFSVASDSGLEGYSWQYILLYKDDSRQEQIGYGEIDEVTWDATIWYPGVYTDPFIEVGGEIPVIGDYTYRGKTYAGSMDLTGDNTSSAIELDDTWNVL